MIERIHTQKGVLATITVIGFTVLFRKLFNASSSSPMRSSSLIAQKGASTSALLFHVPNGK